MYHYVYIYGSIALATGILKIKSLYISNVLK